MPEFSSEVAGTVSRASVMEIEGLGSGATRTFASGLINIKSISSFFIVYSCPTYKKN
jgi:hypothetical protein